ncbi:MAG: AMP-binding protein [Ramlibacter sp.]|nr:AMP-binding protein [Ramlibacter sp.]
MAGIELIVMSPGGMRNPARVNRFWHLCERYGVTLAGAVPTSVGPILEVPVGDADISKIRAGFCGAASLPLAVGERFRQVTGKNLYEVYGMTEASGLIAIDPTAGPGGVGSVGFALPYAQVRARKMNADGRRLRARRSGRADHRGRARVTRLPQPRAQQGRVRRQGRAQFGRPGLHRRDRPHSHRRPREGPDHSQRPQHRPSDDRERDAVAPGSGIGGGCGDAG